MFAFASCNCGPGTVSRMRKEASRRGLDPGKWLNPTKIVTAEKDRHRDDDIRAYIYKYYVACKVMLDAHATADQARQQVAR